MTPDNFLISLGVHNVPLNIATSLLDEVEGYDFTDTNANNVAYIKKALEYYHSNSTPITLWLLRCLYMKSNPSITREVFMQSNDDTRSDLLDRILRYVKNVPSEKEQEYIDSIINIITETEVKRIRGVPRDKYPYLISFANLLDISITYCN